MHNKLVSLLIVSILCFCRCREKDFNKPVRIVTSSMEATLKQGEVFDLVKSDNYDYNDIIVFKILSSYLDAELTFVFRVVAKNGDTVSFKGGDLYVNNRLYNLQKTAKASYVILNDSDVRMFKSSLDSNQSNEARVICRLPLIQAADLERNGIIKRYRISPDSNDTFILRMDSVEIRNRHNFGPIIIPRIGDRVLRNPSSNYFFNSIMEKLTPSGTLSDEVYFVIGDDMDNAIDSRFIGLVENSSVIGKLKLKD